MRRSWCGDFRCLCCGKSTSCLPDFAQPYRLLANATIQAGFAGKTGCADVARSWELLCRYRRRLERFYSKLRSVLGGYYGPSPPREEEGAAALFDRVIKSCGTLANATMDLVDKFGITFFGQYRCHTVLAKG